MLVITRREGEEIVVGNPRDPIGVIRISSIRGDRVQVALEFPKAIDLHRREVADSIVDQARVVVRAAPTTNHKG